MKYQYKYTLQEIPPTNRRLNLNKSAKEFRETLFRKILPPL